MSTDPNKLSFEEVMALADKRMSALKLPKKKRKSTRPIKRTRNKPKKEVTTSGKGYRYVYIDGKPVLEHRFIMETHLQRKLLPHEAVFFKDGDKTNIRPENLILGLKQGVPLDSITCKNCGGPVG